MLTYLGIRLTARCRTQRGASAVEYGLLIAGVAVVIMVAAKTLGVSLVGVFNRQNASVAVPNNN
jgi:pilus assembly protein Flp/PilA